MELKKKRMILEVFSRLNESVMLQWVAAKGPGVAWVSPASSGGAVTPGLAQGHGARGVLSCCGCPRELHSGEKQCFNPGRSFLLQHRLETPFSVLFMIV